MERGHLYEISDNENIYLAEVTEAHKNRVVFSILEPVAHKPLPVRITLLVSLFKFDHFEWMLEKGVEVGVDRFVPVKSERSEKGLDKAAEKRIERWRRILLEASQQCRRDRLPEIEEVAAFEEALRRPATVRLWLEEKEGAPPLLRALPDQRAATDEVAIFVGPEGGWTDRERQAADQAGWRAVSVGGQVLRSETAAVAASAVAMNAWMVSSG